MRLLRFGRPKKEPRHDVSPAVSENRAELDAQWARINELADALDEANAVAESTEILRAKWEAMWRDKCDQLAERTEQRDKAIRHAADLAAENVLLVDRARVAQAALVDVREQLRQALRQSELDRKTIDELGKELAEAIVTAEGIGFAMRDMEQAAAERKDFLDDDRRQVRLMDGTEDHL